MVLNWALLRRYQTMTFDMLPEGMPPDPLVGRCFIVYDEAGRALSKGLVIGRVSSDTFLVRHFSWTTGELSTARVVKLSDMVSPGLKHERRGCYEFFENRDHLDGFVRERTRAAASARSAPASGPAAPVGRPLAEAGQNAAPAKQRTRQSSVKAASKKPFRQSH
jgi:hypothetical protein